MDYLAEKYLRPRKIPSTACSGCGLGQVHKKVVIAIDELGLKQEDVREGRHLIPGKVTILQGHMEEYMHCPVDCGSHSHLRKRLF